MILEKANLDQEQELTEFFDDFQFEDFIHFKVSRPKGFFSIYKGYDFETFILKDKSNKILATASFLYIQMTSKNDKKSKIAFATDLRVLPNRQATLGWHQNFIPVLEKIQKEQNVDGIMSLLARSDRKVLNTFLRSHPHKREIPRYYLYQNYKLTSLHGFLPYSKVNLPSLRARRAKDSDWQKIDLFLQNHEFPYLSSIPTGSHLHTFLKNKNLDLSHVWIAEHKNNEKIVGLTLVLPSSETQLYIPLQYNVQANNFRQFLKFGHLLGWTHSLTKPTSRTNQDLPFNFHHVGLTRVLHPDVFQLLLQEIWKTLKINEFLLYLKDTRDLDLTLHSGCLTAEMDYDLFSVTLPNQDPHSLGLKWDNEPFRIDSFQYF